VRFLHQSAINCIYYVDTSLYKHIRGHGGKKPVKQLLKVTVGLNRRSFWLSPYYPSGVNLNPLEGTHSIYCVHPAEDSNDKERGQCSKNDLLSENVSVKVFPLCNQCYFSYGFSVSVTVVIFQLQLQLLFFSFYFS